MYFHSGRDKCLKISITFYSMDVSDGSRVFNVRGNLSLCVLTRLTTLGEDSYFLGSFVKCIFKLD